MQTIFDRSDGFYQRQLVLTTKEKPVGRVDASNLAGKTEVKAEGILFWVLEGLRRMAANNFKFTESQRTRENRETVKRDNNNDYDFLESRGYIRLKTDESIRPSASKDCYDIYQMRREENNLTGLKRCSFSDWMAVASGKYNLERCNTGTNAAGCRV